jgi:hypothetical protein
MISIAAAALNPSAMNPQSRYDEVSERIIGASARE